MSEPSRAAASRNLPISSMKRTSPPCDLGFSAAALVKCGDQIGFGPTAARLTRYKPRSLHSFADDRDGIVASRNDGKDTPSLRTGGQCVPDRFRHLRAENCGRFCLQVRHFRSARR